MPTHIEAAAPGRRARGGPAARRMAPHQRPSAPALCLLFAALLALVAPPGTAGVDVKQPAASNATSTSTDVQLDLGQYYFNPSVVRHKGVYLSTARTAEMKRVESTTWVGYVLGEFHVSLRFECGGVVGLSG